jgi:hypothetical protein
MKRQPFTPKNIIQSLVDAIRLPHHCFSVEAGEEANGEKSLSRQVSIEDPLTADVILSDVYVYRDQKSLDKCFEDSLPYDSTYGFFDVGDLSNEDIVRHSAKGCDLSQLKHWIIAQGREDELTDDQIAHDLKHPVDTIIKHYTKDGDLAEEACSTLVLQCRPDPLEMAKYVLKAAGGTQKVWSMEFFHTLPRDYIIHIITTEETVIFRRLLDSAHERPVVDLPEDKSRR